MSIALGIMIFMSSIYVGIVLQKYYINKCKIFDEILDFITYAQGEIQFFGTDINELIQKYVTENKTFLAKAMQEFNMPDKCKKEDIRCNYLSERGKDLLLEFINGLCRLDSDTQKEYSTNFKNKILQEIQLSKTELANKGDIYKKLSPFVGLAIAIIIF